MTDFKKTLEWIKPSGGCIAEPAISSITGQKAQAVWSYLTQYHARSLQFQYTGPPAPAINGGSWTVDGWKFNDPNPQKFYPIFKSPDKQNLEYRGLGMYLLPWATYEVGLPHPEITWAKDYTAPGVFTTLYSADTQNSNPCAAYGDRAGLPIHEGAFDEFYYPPNSGGYQCGILSVRQIMVANLMIWEIPWWTLTDEQVEVGPPDVGVGQIIYGYDSDLPKGFGKLIHLMGKDSDDNHINAIEQLTRRTLIQWGHPIGRYIALTENLVNQNIFGHATAPVRVRNLRGLTGPSPVQECFPAVVIQGTAGQSIRFVSTISPVDGNQIATHIIPAGGYAAPTLVPHTSFDNTLDVKINSLDHVTIEVTSALESEMTIHTVALFEGAGY